MVYYKGMVFNSVESLTRKVDDDFWFVSELL